MSQIILLCFLQKIYPLPFEEDFESLDGLDNWVGYNPDGDWTWQETSSASSSDGSWSVFIDNYSDTDGDPTGTLDAFVNWSGWGNN